MEEKVVEGSTNTEEIIEEKKAEYLCLCRKFIHREGLENLLDWLEFHSDFFTAPASTRFHLNEEKGLVTHSLNVYNCLKKVLDAMGEQYKVSDETVAIIALFHDLCKANFYKTEMRNSKVDGKWIQVPYYTVEEKLPYGGHGCKSVFLVERFMKLTVEEAVAINCHMGFKPEEPSIGRAYEQFPIAWALHVADEAATWLLEAKE